MKTTLIAIAAIVLIGAGFWYYQSPTTPTPTESTELSQIEGERTVVTPGTYTLQPALSDVAWAVGKPLIEGYINSGTIGIKEGTITVIDTSASGSVVMDMNTIKVSLTATKPGKESALERHLKSDDFFDVEANPTATFTITSVTPVDAAAFTYTLTGDLTLLGKTNPITVPAEIFMADGTLRGVSEFTIDRTKWGITYGSGSFFDNLANNVIEDEVHLTLSVVGTK
ncbi:MAG: YceI family protein [Patescibacteria group bacterium]